MIVTGKLKIEEKRRRRKALGTVGKAFISAVVKNLVPYVPDT